MFVSDSVINPSRDDRFHGSFLLDASPRVTSTSSSPPWSKVAVFRWDVPKRSFRSLWPASNTPRVSQDAPLAQSKIRPKPMLENRVDEEEPRKVNSQHGHDDEQTE